MHTSVVVSHAESPPQHTEFELGSHASPTFRNRWQPPSSSPSLPESVGAGAGAAAVGAGALLPESESELTTQMSVVVSQAEAPPQQTVCELGSQASPALRKVAQPPSEEEEGAVLVGADAADESVVVGEAAAEGVG